MQQSIHYDPAHVVIARPVSTVDLYPDPLDVASPESPAAGTKGLADKPKIHKHRSRLVQLANPPCKEATKAKRAKRRAAEWAEIDVAHIFDTPVAFDDLFPLQHLVDVYKEHVDFAAIFDTALPPYPFTWCNVSKSPRVQKLASPYLVYEQAKDRAAMERARLFEL